MGGVAPGHRRPSHLIEIGEKLYARSFELVRELVNNAHDADATGSRFSPKLKRQRIGRFEIDPIERPLQAHALTSPVTVGAEALEDRAPP